MLICCRYIKATEMSFPNRIYNTRRRVQIKSHEYEIVRDQTIYSNNSTRNSNRQKF